jgi:hypothetical protein
MNGNAVALRDLDGQAMQRPAIAEQDDIRGMEAQQQVFEKTGPGPQAGAERNGAAEAPEDLVAEIEVDAPNVMAAACQLPAYFLESAAGGALQKYDPPDRERFISTAIPAGDIIISIKE